MKTLPAVAVLVPPASVALVAPAVAVPAVAVPVAAEVLVAAAAVAAAVVAVAAVVAAVVAAADNRRPAVANAIYAASGKRITRLPMTESWVAFA